MNSNCAVRTDFFLVSTGDNASVYPNMGYITIGVDTAGLLNSVFMVATRVPDVAGADSTYVPSDAISTLVSGANLMQYQGHASSLQNLWVAALPSYCNVSFFNPNNFGVKCVIGPFYRFERGYMPTDAETLAGQASVMFNSGVNVFGTANGGVPQVLNYNGVQMSRDQVQARYGIGKIHPFWKGRVRVIRKFLSVLIPPNGRYDFRVKMPGIRSVPYTILSADWLTKYRYTQTCFHYKVFSGVVFDSANAVVTGYGTGPGWGMIHVKPAVGVHASQVTPFRVKNVLAPWYFVNNNPRLAARAPPNPTFNAQAIVEQKVDNAMF